MRKIISLAALIFAISWPLAFGSQCAIPTNCTPEEWDKFGTFSLSPINLTWDNFNDISAIDGGGVTVTTAANYPGGNATVCDETQNIPLRFALPDRVKTMVNYSVCIQHCGTDADGTPTIISSYSNADDPGDFRIFQNIAELRTQIRNGPAAIQANSPVMDSDSCESVCMRVNQTTGVIQNDLIVNATVVAEGTSASAELKPSNIDVVICGHPDNIDPISIALVGMYIINITASLDDIREHHWQVADGGRYPVEEEEAPPPPDTTPPFINITSPVNDTTYTVTSVDLNWTANETVVWAVYSLDHDTNITLLPLNLYQANESLILAECFDNHASVNCDITGTHDNDFTTSGGHTNNPTDPPDSTFDYIFSFSLPAAFDNFSLLTSCTFLGGDADAVYLYNWSASAYQNIGTFDNVCVGIHEFNFSEEDSTHFGKAGALNISLKFSHIVGESQTDTFAFFDLNISYFGASRFNTTLTSLSEGSHNITIWANDSAGNTGQSDSTHFTVSLPAAEAEAPQNINILNDRSTLGGRVLISSSP